MNLDRCKTCGRLGVIKICHVCEARQKCIVNNRSKGINRKDLEEKYMPLVSKYLIRSRPIEKVVLDPPKKELVISRFNENLDWVEYVSQSIDKITIYNKGPDLFPLSDKRVTVKRIANIGREADTWLYHFIARRNSLADTTFLSQGEPFEHSPDFLDLLDLDYDDVYTLTKLYTIDHFYKHSTPKHSVSDFDKVINLDRGLQVRFGDTSAWGGLKHTTRRGWRDWENTSIYNRYFSYGAMYVLPREIVLNHPDDYYIKLINSGLSAYQLEGMWYGIFDKGKQNGNKTGTS